MQLQGVFVCICCQSIDTGTHDQEQCPCFNITSAFWMSSNFSYSMTFSTWSSRKEKSPLSLLWCVLCVLRRGGILMWESFLIISWIRSPSWKMLIHRSRGKWRTGLKWEQTRWSNSFLMCLLPQTDVRTWWYNIIDLFLPQMWVLYTPPRSKEKEFYLEVRVSIYFIIFLKAWVSEISDKKQACIYSLLLSLPSLP